MKNKKLKLFSLISIFALASCGGPLSSSKETNSKTSSSSNVYVDEPLEIYLDTETKRANSFVLSIQKSSCEAKDGKYLFDLEIGFHNEAGTRVPLEIDNCFIIREATNEKTAISVEHNKFYDQMLVFSDGEISYTYPNNYRLVIGGYIPTNFKEERYNITFLLNKKKVVFHLYEIPEEKRQTWTVAYKVNQKTIKTIEVKDKDTIKEEVRYDSEDHQTAYMSWFQDTNFTQRWEKSNPVRSNLTLHGYPTRCLTFSDAGSTQYATLLQINVVPMDNVVVIPNRYNYKDIAIGDNAIRDHISIEKIYIPKAVRSIYPNNFKLRNSPTIYYEGTESEWRSLFVDQSDIYLTNLVYNTKSPY